LAVAKLIGVVLLPKSIRFRFLENPGHLGREFQLHQRQFLKASGTKVGLSWK